MGIDPTYTLENELCPHFDDIDQELMNRLFSEVAAVRSSNEDLFNFTHRRIQVFEYVSGDIYNEHEIYEQFDEHRLRNFAVVIRGPTGTGKSELCWALSHRLRNDGRKVLHIEKNADLMSIMAEEIPQFYEDHTGEQIEGVEEIDRLRQDIRDEKETVAEYAVSKAIIDLRNSDVTVTVPDREQLKDFVASKLTELVQPGGYDTDVSFVVEPEVKNFSFLDVLADQSPADTATMLTDALWDAIRNEYESPSLDTLLEQVGQAFTDTRPVLIFEDWSVTSLDAIRLRDYMERDNENDRWDFIVAGTPDSFDELRFRTQTNEDRFQYYETTKEGEDQVLFLGEDSAIDFIRPYLGYIKSLDGSVSYNRDGTNRVTNINTPGDRSRCDFCNFCDAEFRDLYPFNRTFVQRVYTGLPTDDQQPRKYVQKIFDILTDYYDSDKDVFPPSSSDELSSLTNEIDLADAVYINRDLAKLAEWYGTVEGDVVEVDRRFAVSFGIDAAVEYEAYGVVADEAVLRFPTQNGGAIGGEGGTGVDGYGDEDDENGEDGADTLSPEEELVNELRPRVENWKENPEEWTEVDVYLRKGLRDAIERLTGEFRLWEDAPLEYRVGSGHPFLIGDELAPPNKIHIDQHDFARSDLLDLLEFGVMRSEDPRNADYKSFLNGTGTQITEYARKWRSALRSHELEQGKIFHSGNEYSLTDLAYSGYALCVLLNDPWESLSVERISAAFTAEQTVSLDEDLAEALDDQLDRDDFKRVQTMFEHIEEYRALFEDEFTFTSNAVNRQHLQQYVDQVSPFAVIEGLAKSRIDRVSGKVKFTSSGKNLTTVLEALYYVGNALDELATLDAMTERAEHIRAELDGVNMAYIRDVTTDIQETYSDVLSGSQEALVKFANESQDDVLDIFDAAMLYLDYRDATNKLEQWLALFIGLKLLENRTVDRFESARGFDLTAHPEGRFGEYFLEVSDVLF